MRLFLIYYNRSGHLASGNVRYRTKVREKDFSSGSSSLLLISLSKQCKHRAKTNIYSHVTSLPVHRHRQITLRHPARAITVRGQLIFSANIQPTASVRPVPSETRLWFLQGSDGRRRIGWEIVCLAWGICFKRYHNVARRRIQET